jgi:hypothetical protein
MPKQVLFVVSLMLLSTLSYVGGGAGGQNGDQPYPGIHYSSYYGGWSEDTPTTIHVDDNGFVYISGFMSDDVPVTFSVDGGDIQTHGPIIMKIDINTGELVSSVFFNGATIGAMTTDSNGSLYVTGQYTGPGLPTSYYAYSRDPFGLTDAFVTKFDPNLTELEYSTYIGGSDHEMGYDIIVDGEGNAFVIGQTKSTDFPTEEDGVFAPAMGGYDGFIVKLGPRGQELLGTVTFGADMNDFVIQAVADPSGDIVFTGSTLGGIFTGIGGGFISDSHGGRDVFIGRLDVSAFELDFLALVGGKGEEWAKDLIVEPGGDIILTGSTRSDNFPVTVGALNASHNDSEVDCWVLRLDRTGSSVDFSCLIGGEAETHGTGIGLKGDGTIYVAGTTDTPDFPTTEDAQFPDALGRWDGFYLEMTANGRNITYATYWGSTGHDQARFATSWNDAFYLILFTYSADLETTDNAYQGHKNGHGDIYLVVFDPTEPEVRDDGSAPYTSEIRPFELRVNVADNLNVELVTVKFWWGESGTPRERDLAFRNGTGFDGWWNTSIIVNDATKELHYIVEARDPAGNEVVTTEATVLGDIELPVVVSETSDTNATLGKTARFSIEAWDGIGIAEVVLVITMGSGPQRIVIEGDGTYSVTMDVPRGAGDEAEYRFEITDVAGNVRVTDTKTLPLFNIPPEIDPLPEWKVKVNHPTSFDLRTYISDGNDDLGNLTIKTDNSAIEVDGTTIMALFTSDYKKVRVAIEVSDGDDKAMTSLVIINPDASDDDGGIPGLGAILAILGMAMVAAHALGVRPRRRQVH